VDVGDDDVGFGGVMRDVVEVDEMADKELSSSWRGSWAPDDGPASSSGEGPITSSTMPLNPTSLFCFNMGSMNPGGGHTSSLNIEPVSDVRDFIKLRLGLTSGLKTGVG
jgi:hypothetical protein